MLRTERRQPHSVSSCFFACHLGAEHFVFGKGRYLKIIGEL